MREVMKTKTGEEDEEKRHTSLGTAGEADMGGPPRLGAEDVSSVCNRADRRSSSCSLCVDTASWSVEANHSPIQCLKVDPLLHWDL
ncbi:hypothetical protein EYF80_000352 [Liparis tanakae]|uniref:Uncharacterized protein n=1 Tax=Liparis tanakae TaxID=230148 RepID=A0A4Z2JH53_9TELE|nr:hypothetical protein EYF80_000352 [Liparis tanakae]